jgi:phosphoglycerate dehydrogenase-like enzyme
MSAKPPWRLLFLPPVDPDSARALLGDLEVEIRTPARRDQAALREALVGVDLVLGDWSGRLELGEAEARAAVNCAFVQQPSVGVEQIDLDAFARRGVPVANTAGANAVGVAEWCLAATLAALRSLSWADRQVQEGAWPGIAVANRPSRNLSGRRVGLLGFGAIGRACAERFAALGAEVSYWSRRQREAAEPAGARYRELDELCADSDVLVIVVALAPGTRGLLDARRIALLPPEAVVVNAARGGIVDEAALAAAVRSGALAGAALDVFAAEPLPMDSPLRGSDRILLSPHAAGATRESLAGVHAAFLANLKRAVAGEPPHNVVNGVPGVIVRR